MGYACPVCEVPQRDGEHLAHHLAFTAMLHGDDHEAWLDERADDWRAMEPAALAEVVVADAEEAEYHEVFEDTSDRGHGGEHGGGAGHEHAHGTPFEHGVDAAAVRGRGAGQPDEETRAILEEARELTREMLADDGDGDDGGSSDGADDA